MHDVPYDIVAGNPAEILRYRFDEDTIKKLEESKWWELELDELKKCTTTTRDCGWENTNLIRYLFYIEKDCYSTEVTIFFLYILGVVVRI